MPLPKSSEIAFWHRRYLRQAEWTRELRLHLYRKIGLGRKRRILELGCGTGVIAAEIAERTGTRVAGLDRDMGALEHAAGRCPRIACVNGAAGALPFPSGRFDLIVTHYFWMWVEKPEEVLAECLRVLEPGGHLLSLAEPDYSRGRDEPAQLSVIREQLTGCLEREGADPGMGPKVEKLFRGAGLSTEAGIISQGWGTAEHRREFAGEWRYVEKVLKDVKGLKVLKEAERKAIASGKRRSAMPVHWCLGRKS